MKVGDYIRQEYTNSTALIIDRLKNGSFRALVHDYRGRIVQKSIKGWYPPPTIIQKSDIPAKIIGKIDKYCERNNVVIVA